MEGEVSVGTPRDTLSITPATRDTDSQEVLQEHVGLMDCGQEVQLLAHVSISVFASYIMISVAISILGVCDYQNMWYHDYCRLLLRKYHD